MRAWPDRRGSWPKRGSTARRPARGRASSGGKRCTQWPAHDYVFGDDRRVGWRQRSRLRTASHRHSPSEHRQLRSIETASVLGSVARRSALRENRRLACAKVIVASNETSESAFHRNAPTTCRAAVSAANSAASHAVAGMFMAIFEGQLGNA